ncbi:MAG: lamin tail domain-containing protein [candidate division Zixibacteria bacterium]|nr:lamin tail domain-containing protein [candidate division Zixibacteria bacterium]
MANEPGSATSLEWIELLNWPDTGHGTVTLSGYRYVDGKDTTLLDTGLVVSPGHFVILARRVTGTSSFESLWGNNSGVWGDTSSESYPVIGVTKMSLRNSGDTVTLLWPGSGRSVLWWRSDGPDGISIERIRPNRGDDLSNYALCRAPAGSTPGRMNSVLPLRGDLALDSLWFVSTNPAWGLPLAVRVSVTNVGFGDVNNAVIDLSAAPILSTESGNAQIVDSVIIAHIGEETSQTLNLEWTSPPPGPSHLTARIRSDPDSTNNVDTASTAVRFTQPLVIVSEYMAGPAPGGPDEWVELSNQAGFPVNLSGTRIGDSLNTEALPGQTDLLPPGALWILAESASRFRTFYPGFTGTVFEIPGWRELNNTGDRIRLVGAAGEIIDSVSYRTTYDGNRSTERVELKPALAAPGDWTVCRDPSGATPGQVNSVQRGEPGSLTIDSIQVSPDGPGWGEAITIQVAVHNPDFGPVALTEVSLFEDSDLRSPGTNLTLLTTWSVTGLGEGEAENLTYEWNGASPGIQRVVARIDSSAVMDGSEAAQVVVVHHTQPLIIVSEYLAGPTSDGPGEWVEMYNASQFPIAMNGTALGDSDGHAPLPPETGQINPGDFWILTQNADQFRSFYPAFSGTVLVITGWRDLNNAGDEIRLLGAAGEIIDSLSYRASYGKNQSTERRELSPTFADRRDWGGSRDPAGATPGKPNSINRPQNDLALDSLRIMTVNPGWGEPISVAGRITNVGFADVNSARLALYYSVGGPESPLGPAIGVVPLPPESTAQLQYSWLNAAPGKGRLIARLTADDDTANNVQAVDVVVRHTKPLVIVSEFLVNPESDGPGEWVEIYNAAGFPIAMGGTSLGDSDGLANLSPGAGGIDPGEFWVLTQSADDFRSYYPGFSGTVFELPGWRSLNNSGDQIRLLGAVGEIIDSLSYRVAYGNNYSSERRELSANFADARDWGQSRDPSGATPGKPNSIDRPQNDLAIDWILIGTSPAWHTPMTVHARVTNVGFGSVGGTHLDLYYDYGKTEPRLIHTWNLETLPPERTTEAEYVWLDALPGQGRLTARLSSDEDSSNNINGVSFAVKHTDPLIIVSEFLANPTGVGPGEWVEISNQADFAINLEGVQIGDSTGTTLLPVGAGLMPQGAFWVLAQSAAAFRSFYPSFTGTLLDVPAWRELNNSGDRIRLIGAAGEIIDSVSYRDSYGDNHSRERLSLGPELADSADWAESVDPSGATPGRANSVSRDAAGPFAVQIFPNPVFRGAGEVAQISFTMQIGEKLTLEVFDRSGRLVRTITDEEPAATGALTWDTTDNNGASLRPGPYVLLARSKPSGAVRKAVIVVAP